MAERHRTEGAEKVREVFDVRLRFARQKFSRISQATTRRRVLNVGIDPSILSAAQKRTGIRNHAKLIEAALLLLAMEDDFGLKLLMLRGALSADFELAV